MLLPFLRERPVELHHALLEFLQINRGEGVTAFAGLDSGDAQQGVEGGEQTVGLRQSLPTAAGAPVDVIAAEAATLFLS